MLNRHIQLDHEIKLDIEDSRHRTPNGTSKNLTIISTIMFERERAAVQMAMM